MGYNSVLFICNDQMDTITRDPKGWWEKAKDKLIEVMGSNCRKSKGTFGHLNGANGFQAVCNDHADTVHIIAAGRNRASVLGVVWRDHHTPELQVEILRDLAEQYGYKLVKAKKESK